MVAALLAMQVVALEPVHRLGEEWWAQRHEACVELTRAGGINVAFLGDSITQGWEGAGKAAWDANFGSLGAVNFGFSGDRTEHVLWRLANGELIAAKPNVVVIMIGTNNLGHGSSNPAQTAMGVRAICDLIHKGSPSTKILLLGILPRGRTADDRLRVAVAEATQAFRDISNDKGVVFADTGYPFVWQSGNLKEHLMPDLLHLSAGGYEVWAKAIAPHVRAMLGQS